MVITKLNSGGKRMSTLASPKFKLAQVILSKQEEFTIDEVINDMRKQGVEDITDTDIKKVLKNYRDNGIVYTFGSKYLLSL